MEPLIEDNALVLFEGDSVTDCGRCPDDDRQLGCGCVMMAAGFFSALFPEKHVRFLNRGVSGSRIRDLRARCGKYCEDLNPTWVSILIGINDTWRRYDSNDPTPVADFERDYRHVLTFIHEEVEANIILCEPFLLPVPADRAAWREDLDPKIAVVRRLAAEFKAILVPLDGVFAQAACRREPAYWVPDGVHPSTAGHGLIAEGWLRAVRAR